MNYWEGFYEKNSRREWVYPLLFSLVLHLVVFLVAVLPSTFFSPQYQLKPVYSVRLVDAPLTAKKTVKSNKTDSAGRDSVGAKPKVNNIEIKAKRQKIVRKKIPPKELETLQALEYEKKLKSLALKKAKDKKERLQREEHLKAALERLKEQSKQQHPSDFKEALANIRERIGQEGVGIETRGSITGDGQSVEASLLNIYLEGIWGKIRSNWVIPPYLLRQKGLETVIVVRIRKNGIIESVWMEKRSGNTYFDQSAMRAISLSAPFSPLPPGIKQSILEIGVRFYPSNQG